MFCRDKAGCGLLRVSELLLAAAGQLTNFTPVPHEPTHVRQRPIEMASLVRPAANKAMASAFNLSNDLKTLNIIIETAIASGGKHVITCMWAVICGSTV